VNKKNRLAWYLFLLAFVVTALPDVYADDQASWPSPEAQRFDAEKQRLYKDSRLVEEARVKAANLSYVIDAKRRIDDAWLRWHTPAGGKLLITKVKVEIMFLNDKAKKDNRQLIASSGSDAEDKAVKDCIDSVPLPPLPGGVYRIQLYWTLMSDGSVNMVENTDSPEANAYYTELLGGKLSPQGDKVIPQMDLESARALANRKVDFRPYMEDLQRRIKRAWLPPNKEHERDRVIVVFKIHNDGALTNLRLDKSSGERFTDQAALQAVEHASPFRPLPDGAAENVDIEFRFDYTGANGSYRRL